MSDRPSVEVVALSERAAGLNTIVAAFAADPLTRWMMPKADSYLTHAAAVFDAFGGAAFDAGTAFQIADFGGAALWIPPGHDHDDGDDSLSEGPCRSSRRGGQCVGADGKLPPRRTVLVLAADWCRPSSSGAWPWCRTDETRASAL